MAFTILGIGLLVFFGHFLTGFFEKTKIPDVLILTIAGIILGPILHVVKPEDFGKVGPVFTTLALIIILFEGGIHLNVRSLVSHAGDTVTISVATFALTVLALSLVADLLLPVDYPTALLIGVILGGTSSAVVVPMIRVLRIGERTRTILFLESALTDVLVVVLSLALLQAMVAGAASPDGGIDGSSIAAGIAMSFLMSAVIGAVGAFLWSALLDKVRQFPNTVFTTFAAVFILYGVADLQGYSGAIAALAFGIAVANFSNIPDRLVGKLFTFKLVGFAEHERAFFAEVVFLVKTFFFVFLGLSISLTDLRTVSVGLALVPVFYVGRLFVVRLLADREVTRREAMLMTSLIPKGLASAVLAALPLQMGLASGAIVQSTVYAVILFSIVFCAALVLGVERGWLDRFASGFFTPFSESLPVPASVPPGPRISQQSLGLPQLTTNMIEPNPIRDLADSDAESGRDI